MIIEIDFVAKALYLRLANGAVADSIELADTVVADVDASGTVLGIECVRVDRFAPFVAAHPDLVPLPSRVAYRSVDRNKSWQTAVDPHDGGMAGDRGAQAAMVNGTFMLKLVAEPEHIDRIDDGQLILHHPSIARN